MQFGDAAHFILVHLFELGGCVLGLHLLGLNDVQLLVQLVHFLGHAGQVDLRFVEGVGLQVDGEQGSLVQPAN